MKTTHTHTHTRARARTHTHTRKIILKILRLLVKTVIQIHALK